MKSTNDVLNRIMTHYDNERRIEEQEYREINVERNRLMARRVAERQRHQFSDSIGGCSANYRAPYFGR